MFDMILFSVCAILLLSQVTLTAQIGPSAVVWTLLIIAMFFLPYGLMTAELGSTYPDTGGIYAWIVRAFGKPLGYAGVLVVLGECGPVGAIGLPDVLRGAHRHLLPRHGGSGAGRNRDGADRRELAGQCADPGHRQVGVQPGAMITVGVIVLIGVAGIVAWNTTGQPRSSRGTPSR